MFYQAELQLKMLTHGGAALFIYLPLFIQAILAVHTCFTLFAFQKSNTVVVPVWVFPH